MQDFEAVYELCYQYANGFITHAEFAAGSAALNHPIHEIGPGDMPYVGDLLDTIDAMPEFETF